MGVSDKQTDGQRQNNKCTPDGHKIITVLVVQGLVTKWLYAVMVGEGSMYVDGFMN